MASPTLLPCPGCGVQLHDVSAGTHAYIGASSGCWSKFGELLAKEFSDGRYGKVHRLTVDAYAAQHPGIPSPQSVRSVAIHLMALCLVLDRRAPVAAADRAMKVLGRRDQDLWWLDPPRTLGTTTVLDVIEAVGADDHADKVHRWAAEVWNAWAVHHDTVRAWLDRATRQR